MDTPKVWNSIWKEKSESQCASFADLWNDRENRLILARDLLRRVKSFKNSDILPFDSRGELSLDDFFLIICIGFPYSDDEGEPILVSRLLVMASRRSDIVPLITEDQGLVFCAKVLTCLSFLRKHLEKRTNLRGFPSPDFYRKQSQSILSRADFDSGKAVAEHHEMWEEYLSEAVSF